MKPELTACNRDNKPCRVIFLIFISLFFILQLNIISGLSRLNLRIIIYVGLSHKGISVLAVGL